MASENIVCDTDVIIDYLNENNARHNETKDIIDYAISLDKIILSSVSTMELIIGAVNKEDLDKINKKIARFNVADIDNDISKYAVLLLQQYSLSHGLGLADSLIAATSVITGFELFTYNTKDYKFIDKIRLYQF